jgi:glycosyltransferase involved in cell wall biosynthesis
VTFSIVIATHNPNRALLSRAITAIATQTFPREQIELLVVDNASEPPLGDEVLAGFGTNARIIREPKLGVSHARVSGIAASKGELIVFVDDDNILAPDYLETASRFMTVHPGVGAAGGVITPEFETPLAPALARHSGLLALRDYGPDTVISTWRHAEEFPWCAPAGAGMVLRTACARRYLLAIQSQAEFSPGRVGSHFLGGCEDAEIIMHGVLLGGGQTAYHPALRLLHCIPARRIQPAYLGKLAYATGITWGQFCVRYRLWSPIPKWSLPLRIVRSFVRERAWRIEGWIAWRTHAGRFVGRASRPPRNGH